jgi:hypothetical protein
MLVHAAHVNAGLDEGPHYFQITLQAGADEFRRTERHVVPSSFSRGW